MSDKRFRVKNMSLRHMCFLAVLVALFVVLDRLSITINNNIKITFGGLPILIAAMCFGPVAGLCVGLVGAFLGQALSVYGLTITTPIWILPAGARGLSMGLILNATIRTLERIGESGADKPVGARGISSRLSALTPFEIKLCAVINGVLISSLLVTALNTLAMYVDSKIFGYYTYAYVFGATVFRLISGALTSVCYVALLMPIDRALKRIL